MNKIQKNFISVFTGNIGGKILVFLFSMYVARVYGKEVFGSINFANSMISYFLMISSMGLQGYAVVAISRNIKEKNNIYNKILSYRIILAIFSIIALLIIVPISNIIYENKMMTLFYGLNIITNALYIDWYFNSTQEMEYISYSIIIQNVISFILLIVLSNITMKENIYIIPISLFIGNAISVIYLINRANKDIKYTFVFSISELADLVKKGFPFFFSGVFATMNCNLDILILGVVSTNEQVGLYSSAYKIINILIIGITMIFTPIFPVIIDMFNKKEYIKLSNLLNKVRKIILVIIFPLVIGGVLLSSELMMLLFGDEYYRAGIALKILIIYVGILYIRELYGYQLSASGKQKQYMNVVVISSFSNLVLNFIFIPKYGFTAAAVTTLISEVINLILMRNKCIKYFPEIIFNKDKILGIILSTSIMGGLVYILKCIGVNALIIIVMSVLIYGLCIVILKVVSLEEIKSVKGGI